MYKAVSVVWLYIEIRWRYKLGGGCGVCSQVSKAYCMYSTFMRGKNSMLFPVPSLTSKTHTPPSSHTHLREKKDGIGVVEGANLS